MVSNECYLKGCRNQGTDRFTFESTGEYGYFCLGCIHSFLKGNDKSKEVTVKQALEMDWIDRRTAKKLEPFYYSKKDKTSENTSKVKFKGGRGI